MIPYISEKMKSHKALFKSSLRFLSKTNFLIKASDAVITSSPYNLDYCLKNNQKENISFIPCHWIQIDSYPSYMKTIHLLLLDGLEHFLLQTTLIQLKMFIRIASSYNVKILLITNFDYKIEGLDIEVIRWKKMKK